jgi:hypothetical protein
MLKRFLFPSVTFFFSRGRAKPRSAIATSAHPTAGRKKAADSASPAALLAAGVTVEHSGSGAGLHTVGVSLLCAGFLRLHMAAAAENLFSRRWEDGAEDEQR